MARKHSGGEAPDPINDPFHEKLSRLVDRKRKGRSDADIAKESGMSPAAFSRLLGGGVPDPRLSTLRAILKALDATLCHFEKA